MNHPLDIHFEASSSEGWPVFVCEVWERYDSDTRSLIGCGCTWLPALSSKQIIDVAIWKPTSNSMGLDALREMMLPSCPDLKLLREVTMSVGMRAKLQVLSIGSLQLKINSLTSGFDVFGVQC